MSEGRAKHFSAFLFEPLECKKRNRQSSPGR
jgi:hypothetical protein